MSDAVFIKGALLMRHTNAVLVSHLDGPEMFNVDQNELVIVIRVFEVIGEYGNLEILSRSGLGIIQATLERLWTRLA